MSMNKLQSNFPYLYVLQDGQTFLSWQNNAKFIKKISIDFVPCYKFVGNTISISEKIHKGYINMSMNKNKELAEILYTHFPEFANAKITVTQVSESQIKITIEDNQGIICSLNQ